MLIALLSDIHDHLDNMRAALRQLSSTDCRHMLFLGDMAQISTFRELRAVWPHELDLVAGNNDYPREDFARCAREWSHTRYHGESAELVLDNRRIYMTHVPGYSLSHIATFGEFDAIFFGHTHRAEHHFIGSTLIANPGDLQGRYGRPSYALYDTTRHTLSHVSL